MNKRQFFRNCMKAELKSLGKSMRFYKRILRANGRKASLGNITMLALGMSID